MPNWCSNSIEIQGTKEQINKFVSFLDEKNGKDWFDFFKPTPTELKEEGWYEWNVENWGTKWNCDAQDWMKVENPNDIIIQQIGPKSDLDTKFKVEYINRFNEFIA